MPGCPHARRTINEEELVEIEKQRKNFYKKQNLQHVYAVIIGLPIFALLIFVSSKIIEWTQSHIELAKLFFKIGFFGICILFISWFLGIGFIMFIWDSTWCINFRKYIKAKYIS